MKQRDKTILHHMLITYLILKNPYELGLPSWCLECVCRSYLPEANAGYRFDSIHLGILSDVNVQAHFHGTVLAHHVVGLPNSFLAFMFRSSKIVVGGAGSD